MNEPRKLKVLLYDVETSPYIGYTWDTWEANMIKVIHPKQILSFAWKWLDAPEVQSLGLVSYPGYRRDKRNNKQLMRALHGLFEQADVVVGHNVKRFDNRRANTDLLRNKLYPNWKVPLRAIDTLKIAKTHFDFPSNSLDALGEYLGVGRKVKHPGFPMWEGCLNGNLDYWKQLLMYNKGDVVLLERVYKELLPWIPNHPRWKQMKDGSWKIVTREH